MLVGNANARDYNGSRYYEIEVTSFTEGEEASLRRLVEGLGIVISNEECAKHEEAGRKSALRDD